MNKGIELCGIKLGDTFDENKFKVAKKQIIPGGDYMSEIAKPYLMGRMMVFLSIFSELKCSLFDWQQGNLYDSC